MTCSQITFSLILPCQWNLGNIFVICSFEIQVTFLTSSGLSEDFKGDKIKAQANALAFDIRKYSSKEEKNYFDACHFELCNLVF